MSTNYMIEIHFWLVLLKKFDEFWDFVASKFKMTTAHKLNKITSCNIIIQQNIFQKLYRSKRKKYESTLPTPFDSLC